MFLRKKKRKNGKFAIQVVESVRRGNSVKQKVIKHVGQASDDVELAKLMNLGKYIISKIKNERETTLPLFDPIDIEPNEDNKDNNENNTKELNVDLNNIREEQRVILGIRDIFGKLFDELNLNEIIKSGYKRNQWNKILKQCVLARIANPDSKRQTATFLERDYGIKVSLEKIYRMMDHLYKEEDKIKKVVSNVTCDLFDNEVDVLFFDVTTLYFESFEPDELRASGFSKDGKFKETQVMLSLVTTSEGLPITYKLFPGNTYEGNTLLNMIEELKYEYNIRKILLVADRAMFTKSNLELMDSLGVEYIVAAKLKTLSNKVKSEILTKTQENIEKTDKGFVTEYELNNRRLIVSYSVDRAKKDEKDRDRLVERLMKKVKNNKIKLKNLITNNGSKKYVKINKDEAVINEEKIKEDAKFDGLHGIITNCKDKSASELLERYKGLWQIEDAFRVNKHDLRMRPIYHWNPERIRSHISICYLAYALVKHALYRIKLVGKISISFKELRNELLHVQASIVKDITTNQKYVIPSGYTSNQRKIYLSFGLNRSEIPYKI